MITGNEALDYMIMDSNMRAQEIIDAMKIAYADGETDADYSVEGLLEPDVALVDETYDRLFGGR